MLNIFGMRKVLKLGVFIVILLPVVDFVLVLVIAVVSRASAHIGQRLPFVDEHDELVARHVSGAVCIKQGQYLPRYLSSALGRDILIRFVIEAIGPEYLFGLPFAVGIEIVKQEKGGRIEIAYVVLLCDSVLATDILNATERLGGHWAANAVARH